MAIVTERFAGTLLAGVHIDTYHMLNGDNWGEYELEYLSENGEPSDYDDYDWNYDHHSIVEAFAGHSVDAIIDQLGNDIIKSATVVDWGSPREYNFTSDWYEAKWTVDMDALDKWLEEHNFDLDEYVAEFHGSRDGFVSFIPSRLNDPRERDWTLFFLKLDAYVRSELDEEKYNYYMWEQEDSVYSENVTYTLREKV